VEHATVLQHTGLFKALIRRVPIFFIFIVMLALVEFLRKKGKKKRRLGKIKAKRDHAHS